MPSLDVLSSDELQQLDAAIDCIPVTRLREKTGAALLRSGMRPVDILRAPRSGFAPGDAERLPQITYPSKDGTEITVLTGPAGQVVDSYLITHHHRLVLPGMTMGRLLGILDDRLSEAGIRTVSHGTLRNSVRLAALAEGAA